MTRISDFLQPRDYKNYRNVRAAALMFIVLGGILALAGIGLLFSEPSSGEPPPSKIVDLLLACVGLAGVVGGVAVRMANPTWSKLIYVLAALYVLAFPIGTILSVVLFIGLGRYMDDVARFRHTSMQPAAG